MALTPFCAFTLPCLSKSSILLQMLRKRIVAIKLLVKLLLLFGHIVGVKVIQLSARGEVSALGGVCPGSVCLGVGVCLPGGCLPGGVSAWGDTPPVNRMTDRQV